jgi:hypothetical protein
MFNVLIRIVKVVVMLIQVAAELVDRMDHSVAIAAVDLSEDVVVLMKQISNNLI